MSWCKAAAPLLALAVLLSACGFTPLHAGPGAPAAAYAQIEVASIPDREGQYLRNLLVDRLYTGGRPADARYVLYISPLETASADLGIQRDATVTRKQLEIRTRMKLVDRATNAAVLERGLRSVGGYDVLDAHYATLVVKRSTIDNMLDDLANTAMAELDLYLRRAP